MLHKRVSTYSISTGSILKIVAIILILAFLWNVREVLAILFASLIFAAALDSIVDYLQRLHIPRAISVLGIYALIISIIALIFVLLIPLITEQVSEIAIQFPNYYEKVIGAFNYLQTFSQEHGLENDIQKGLNQLNSKIGNTVGQSVKGFFTTLGSVVGSISNFFLILIITFYMIVEEQAMKRGLRQFLPAKYQPYISQLVNKIQLQVGKWLRGQVLLSFIIGILTTLLLWIFGIRYALVLGLIAGVLEFVPYLGPIISAVPAVFLAFFQSPAKALIVLIIYIVIQQLENNLIVPKVTRKTIGLNPIITIAVLLIGMKVGGVIGALLAIPVTTAISVIVEELFQQEEEEAI